MRRTGPGLSGQCQGHIETVLKGELRQHSAGTLCSGVHTAVLPATKPE